jgi:hypothetical protein
MILPTAPCDPAVHTLCMRIARRCTMIVRGTLRDDEVSDCFTEMYKAARDEVEKKPAPEEL